MDFLGPKGTGSNRIATFGEVGGRGILNADAAIANTETVVVSYIAAVGELAVGSTFAIEAYCIQAGTNAATPTIRIRIGNTTLTGNIAASLTGSVGTTAVPSFFRGLITIRSIGAGGTAIGSLFGDKQAIAPIISPTAATVAVNTTTQQRIELTFISGQASNTYTFKNAVIYQVK